MDLRFAEADVRVGRARRRRAALAGEKIAFIGNYPPQQCGIASFTSDLFQALTGAVDAEVSVAAIGSEATRKHYPPEVTLVIERGDAASYVQAAARLNARGVSIVCLQHEFGIFGGDAGDHILKLLDQLNASVIVTLHTISPRFDPAQTRVLGGLIARADLLVVMSEKGRAILEEVYAVAPDKIAVIPHGVPVRPFPDADDFKRRFGWSGSDVLMTFGLLGRSKGVETMIRAMPDIVRARPSAKYVILGATHPNIVAQEGEKYRDELKALAENLGVADHVDFINRFVGGDELIDYLSAADIYVTAYRNEAQITSGTLSYAYALGKPVISTPYWHAAELLADGRGVLCPFGDAAAFADAAIKLLGDDELRRRMGENAYDDGRRMHWPVIAENYAASFASIRAEAFESARKVVRMSDRNGFSEWRAPLAYLQQMTDEVGILQHATMDIPNRHEGYCIDDNARALLAMTQLSEAGRASPVSVRFETIYASFVNGAWNAGNGRFRNFMSFDRRFLDDAGSEDSHGRTMHALAHARQHATSADHRAWADWMFFEALPASDDFVSPRAIAHGVNALCAVDAAAPGRAAVRDRIKSHAHTLHGLLKMYASPDWFWFEDVLAYENALLPSALMSAGRRLGDDQMCEDAVSALTWLSCMQTSEDGWFRPVGTQSYGVSRTLPRRFDQQPIEAYATIAAYGVAAEVDPASGWAAKARGVLRWFEGHNDLGRRLYDPANGSCCDGLHADRENRNKGAESALAALMSYTMVSKAAARRKDLVGPEILDPARIATS